MTTLSSLRPWQRRHQPKRVGRGNASGKGTTAGRGTKGQRARTGGRKKLIRRGLKHLTERTPKVSGWTSRRSKLAAVNLSELVRIFADNQPVDLSAMRRAGLLNRRQQNVKVIGRGPIKKRLHVQAQAFSAAAAAAVTKAGGTATILMPAEPPGQKNNVAKA